MGYPNAYDLGGPGDDQVDYSFGKWDRQYVQEALTAEYGCRVGLRN